MQKRGFYSHITKQFITKSLLTTNALCFRNVSYYYYFYYYYKINNIERDNDKLHFYGYFL